MSLQISWENRCCTGSSRRTFDFFCIKLHADHIWAMTSLEEKIDFITGSIWLDIRADQRLETCDKGQKVPPYQCDLMLTIKENFFRTIQILWGLRYQFLQFSNRMSSVHHHCHLHSLVPLILLPFLDYTSGIYRDDIVLTQWNISCLHSSTVYHSKVFSIDSTKYIS